MCVIVTLLNDNWHFYLIGVVGGCSWSEFILLLFIGVVAAGCWSKLRGGCFWEVYVVINWGHLF